MIRSETRAIRDDLSGELHRTQSTKFLLIMCHGYQSSTAHPALLALTKALCAKGYAMFTFNFSGKDPLDLAQQSTDIGDIADHFASEYSQIILVAGSFGALSCSIAARHKNIAGLVTINGFFGVGRLGWQYKPTFLAFRALSAIIPRRKKIWNFYKQNYQPEQIAIPCLIIHSRADRTVFIDESKLFFEKLTSPKQFVELEDADHDLSSSKNTDEVADSIANWLYKLP